MAAICFAAGENAASKRFSDVPDNHWAAGAVQQLAEEGILKGYPDSTFRGDRPITRYELAVALARFAEFIEARRKPLVPEGRKTGKKPAQAKCPPWAMSSIDFLTSNLFLPANSPIIRDGSKNATGEDLAQALSSMAARIIELEVADPGPTDVP